MYSSIYWILLIGVALVGYLVQWNLKNKFKKYSKIALGGGMTGKDVAEQMLRENGITNVKVVSTNGILTDNYNPLNLTISLSESVYTSYSVTAAAVAAHETGHAIQHAKAYGPLKMRSALVPVISFSSQWVSWIIMGGLLLMGSGKGIGSTLLLIGILLYASITVFSFITLPVEIDASKRALAWLNNAGITNSHTYSPAKETLEAAAYTYVAAALSSLAMLIYYILIYLGRRN